MAVSTETASGETTVGAFPFKPEKRGIDHIPAEERRGSARRLALMWSGVVLNAQVVVYGVLLVSFGLNPLQCLFAIVLGNLTWIITGVCSLAGPAAGTTSFAISRAALGRNGNRPIAFLNWVMQIGYEVVDLVLMVLAATALLKSAGVSVGDPLKVALVLALSLVQSVLPALGHAAIMRALHVLVAPFAALFLVLAWLTADRLHLSSGHPAGWAAFLGGVALAASSSGLGWSSSAADYSRYLPSGTSRRAIVSGVTLGAGVPQSLLMLLGVGVATVAPAAVDPISGLHGVYPQWFLTPYLLLLIVQLAAVNAVDLYSSGVTLQAIGIKIARWKAVLVDGAICATISIGVVFSGNFNTFLSDFLLFMIIWFSPWAAIFVTDYLLRQGHYDLDSLSAQTGGSYVRRGGLHAPGVIAQLAGMGASALWINTSVFVGPLAKSAANVDLSVPAGFIIGAVVYFALSHRRVRAESLRSASPGDPAKAMPLPLSASGTTRGKFIGQQIGGTAP